MAQAQNPPPARSQNQAPASTPAPTQTQAYGPAPRTQQASGAATIRPQSGTDANGDPMYSVNTGVYNDPYMQQEQNGITGVTSTINNQQAAQSAATPVDQTGYAAQGQALGYAQQQANGQGPAAQAVQMQSQNTMNQGINAAMAMAGSQRGGNAGEALRQGELGQAQVTGQAANQAAMNTLNSEQAGQQNMGSISGAMQGEALGQAQLGQQNNQFNAGATNGQQQFRDSSDMSLLGASNNLFQTQYGNNIQGAQYGAGSANDVTQANAGHQISQQNATTSAVGTGAQIVGTAANVAQGIGSAASDKRVKKDIEAGDPDVAEFLDSLKAQTWDYKAPEKHGEGRRLGVMAQDLQKSGLGDHMVSPDDEGTLRVDYGKGMAAIVASLAYLNDKIKSLESK